MHIYNILLMMLRNAGSFQLWVHNHTVSKPETACMPPAFYTLGICKRRNDVLNPVASTLTASMAAC